MVNSCTYEYIIYIYSIWEVWSFKTHSIFFGALYEPVIGTTDCCETNGRVFSNLHLFVSTKYIRELFNRNAILYNSLSKHINDITRQPAFLDDSLPTRGNVWSNHRASRPLGTIFTFIHGYLAMIMDHGTSCHESCHDSCHDMAWN